MWLKWLFFCILSRVSLSHPIFARVHAGRMRAPLRWVLWDVKDTLLKVRTSVGEQYAKEVEHVGVKLSPVEVGAAFQKVHRNYFSRYPNYGVSEGLDGQAWWMGVVKDTLYQCRVTDPELLNTIAYNLYHNFCSAENWEVTGIRPQIVASFEHFTVINQKVFRIYFKSVLA